MTSQLGYCTSIPFQYVQIRCGESYRKLYKSDADALCLRAANSPATVRTPTATTTANPIRIANRILIFAESGSCFGKNIFILQVKTTTDTNQIYIYDFHFRIKFIISIDLQNDARIINNLFKNISIS